MLLHLPYQPVDGASAVPTSCRHATALPAPRAVAATDGKVATARPQQRLALAVALGQLPSGTRLQIGDTNGREWCVSPVHQATAIELREAV